MTQQASPGSVIRPMEARDVPVVAEIEYESFPCPWPEEQFRECLKYPVFRCLVAVHNNHITGYIIGLYESETLHILDLATAVEVRRQGFARLLLRRLLADGARQGLRWAYLEVRTRNLRARALYESEGFTQAEFLPNHYPTPPDDGLRLARSL